MIFRRDKSTSIMSTINNTTASDNSSDSTSNNKKSTKSEIEIIDQKIVKCFNEINFYKQKIQREWSKQMNSHLKNFYPDDSTNDQNDSVNKTTNNDSINSNVNNSFSTPHQQNESSEYEKKIALLNRKLRSYEKRRQKLLYESKKEQDTNLQNHIESNDEPKNDSKNGSTSVLNSQTVITSTNSNPPAPTLQITPTSTSVVNNNLYLSNSQNLPTNLNSKLNLSNTRNGSFIITNNNVTQAFNSNTKIINSDDFNNSQPKSNSLTNDNNDKLTSFYLNQDANPSTVKFNTNPGDLSELLNDEHNPNRSLDRNMFLFQFEQLYFITSNLKMQQDKIQSDLEDMQKKIQDNHQILMKELQNSSTQISDHIHKISFNFYKSCDQKLEELKSSYDRSIQSFNYNLTHCHRDVKEAKEDVSYMKNKIEIIDKSQKVHNIETNPTNYYQLFYKLLDIILTLATIILLAFTNIIASIKFVFLLYPRTIVILLFFYFFVFYIVDYDKLETYFDHFILHDSAHDSSRIGLKAHSFVNDHSNSIEHSSIWFRAIHSIYGLLFHFKKKSNIETSSSASS